MKTLQPIISPAINTKEGRVLLAESIRYLAGKDPKSNEKITLDCAFLKLCYEDTNA